MCVCVFGLLVSRAWVYDIIADVIRWLETWRSLPDGSLAAKEDKCSFLGGLRGRRCSLCECFSVLSAVLCLFVETLDINHGASTACLVCFILLKGPSGCNSLS